MVYLHLTILVAELKSKLNVLALLKRGLELTMQKQFVRQKPVQ